MIDEIVEAEEVEAAAVETAVFSKLPWDHSQASLEPKCQSPEIKMQWLKLELHRTTAKHPIGAFTFSFHLGFVKSH